VTEVVHPEDVKHPPPPRKDRWAATIADWCATVEFAGVNLLLIVVWAATGGFGIDPFPFGLLTFVLSVEAILLTIFVLVQNRLESNMQKREIEADLKNDAIAAEESEVARKALARIERKIDRLRT
jgi:uncharacterized membrane protein